MNLHSCANCCHNGLQYDSIGSRLGYCTLWRLVLRHADHTTCGSQRRKDLLFQSAELARRRQCERFPAYEITRVDGQPLNGTTHEYVSNDRSLLSDPVGSTVSEYRDYERIATFAQLRRTPGGRAELALTSLSRAYVANCVESGGTWTAGVHIMWWVRERFEKEPEPDLRYDQDLRYELPVSPERQLTLAKWSLLMLRLMFLSDMGRHAAQSQQGDEAPAVIREAGQAVMTLETIADDAAEETGTDLGSLRTWVQDMGLRRLDEALPRSRYDAIRAEVHRPRT